jgi:hypothetical protein
MTRRKDRKNDNPFDDVVEMTQPFLPDESSESARAVAIDLRDRLAKLEQQMLAQYSAMASYATIAQHAVDTARAESRHDLDRSQATMIGLIERVRRECNDSIQGVESRTGGGSGSDGARVTALEQRLVAFDDVLSACMATQSELIEAVGALMQERMQREGWLVSSGSADDLSLR